MSSAPPTTLPCHVLARLIAMLPPLDFTWPDAQQRQWWHWFEFLVAEAKAHG